MTGPRLRNMLEVTGVLIDLRIEERVWTEAGHRFAKYAARRREQLVRPAALVAILRLVRSLLQADQIIDA